MVVHVSNFLSIVISRGHGFLPLNTCQEMFVLNIQIFSPSLVCEALFLLFISLNNYILIGQKTCNFVIFDKTKTVGHPNCYMFNCPLSAGACPMKPSEGMNSYKLIQGKHERYYSTKIMSKLAQKACLGP